MSHSDHFLPRYWHSYCWARTRIIGYHIKLALLWQNTVQKTHEKLNKNLREKLAVIHTFKIDKTRQSMLLFSALWSVSKLATLFRDSVVSLYIIISFRCTSQHWWASAKSRFDNKISKATDDVIVRRREGKTYNSDAINLGLRRLEAGSVICPYRSRRQRWSWCRLGPAAASLIGAGPTLFWLSLAPVVTVSTPLRCRRMEAPATRPEIREWSRSRGWPAAQHLAVTTHLDDDLLRRSLQVPEVDAARQWRGPAVDVARCCDRGTATGMPDEARWTGLMSECRVTAYDLADDHPARHAPTRYL